MHSFHVFLLFLASPLPPSASLPSATPIYLHFSVSSATPTIFYTSQIDADLLECQDVRMHLMLYESLISLLYENILEFQQIFQTLPCLSFDLT